MNFNYELREGAFRRAFSRVWKAQHPDVKVPVVRCVNVKGDTVEFLLKGASSSGMFPGWGYSGDLAQFETLALAALCRQRKSVDKHRFSDVIAKSLAGFSRGPSVDHSEIERVLTDADRLIGAVPLTALVLRGKALLDVRAYGLEYPIRRLARVDAFCDVCCDFGGMLRFEKVGGQGGGCPPRPPRGRARRKTPLAPTAAETAGLKSGAAGPAGLSRGLSPSGPEQSTDIGQSAFDVWQALGFS